MPRYTKEERKFIDLVEGEKEELYEAYHAFHKIKEAVEALQDLQRPFLDLEWWIQTEQDNRPRFFTVGHAISEGTFDPSQFAPFPSVLEEEFRAEVRLEVAQTKREIARLEKRLEDRLEMLERWKEEEE